MLLGKCRNRNAMSNVAVFHIVSLPRSDSHGEAEHAGEQVHVREQVTVLGCIRGDRFSDCLSRLTGMMFIGGLILEKTYAFLNDVNEVSRQAVTSEQ